VQATSVGGAAGQGAAATAVPAQGPGQVVVVTPTPGGGLLMPGGGDPALVYEAARNQRRELASQLEDLEDQREELASTLAGTPQSETATRAGLEQRITALDQRIITLDKQLEQANAAVSRAAGIPGAIVPPPPPPPQSGPPEEFWVIAGLILVPTAFILTIAYARRLWRRGAAAVTAIPQDIYDRFTRVEQSIDSVAVEVERIGEGQRYLTRLMSGKSIGSGAAQPIETKNREADKVR
jgi:hypothetical protein